MLSDLTKGDEVCIKAGRYRGRTAWVLVAGPERYMYCLSLGLATHPDPHRGIEVGELLVVIMHRAQLKPTDG